MTIVNIAITRGVHTDAILVDIVLRDNIFHRAYILERAEISGYNGS